MSVGCHGDVTFDPLRDFPEFEGPLAKLRKSRKLAESWKGILGGEAPNKPDSVCN